MSWEGGLMLECPKCKDRMVSLVKADEGYWFCVKCKLKIYPESSENVFPPKTINGEKTFCKCTICEKNDLLLVGEQYKGRCVECYVKGIDV